MFFLLTVEFGEQEFLECMYVSLSRPILVATGRDPELQFYKIGTYRLDTGTLLECCFVSST